MPHETMGHTGDKGAASCELDKAACANSGQWKGMVHLEFGFGVEPAGLQAT